MSFPASERAAGSESCAKILIRLGRRFRLSEKEAVLFARAAREATEAERAEAVENALFHRTGGLLRRHLRAAGVEPPTALVREYHRVSVSNLAWEGELRRIAPALREAGVRVLLIKGAALQFGVYDDPGLRPMEDVDWILPGDDAWGCVFRALEREGYGRSGESDAFRARGPFLIELHRNVLGDERVPARLSAARRSGEGGSVDEEVWARALPAPLGEAFCVPSPEDHLLILCTHLMKHSFEPGIWFADLEALLEAEADFDWEATLARARAWGVLRPLAYAFRNLGALEEGAEADGGAGLLPACVREALRAVRPTRLDGVLLSLAAAGGRLEGEKEEWQTAPVANLLWLSSAAGFGGKFRLLWEAAFPRDELMAEVYFSYRPRLRWWYLALRALDLLRLGLRLAPRLLAAARGKAE